jgi:hypothetical protein
MISRCFLCVWCVFVFAPIVARQRHGKNPLFVARQRLGKTPFIVARQRLGKTLPIVARQCIKESRRLVLPRTSRFTFT